MSAGGWGFGVTCDEYKWGCGFLGSRSFALVAVWDMLWIYNEFIDGGGIFDLYVMSIYVMRYICCGIELGCLGTWDSVYIFSIGLLFWNMMSIFESLSRLLIEVIKKRIWSFYFSKKMSLCLKRGWYHCLWTPYCFLQFRFSKNSFLKRQNTCDKDEQ